MTLIHGSGTLLRGRTEESAALQKRLLQDLERQWLDTWGKADQMQPQPAPPDGKPVPHDAAAPTGQMDISQPRPASLRADPAATHSASELPIPARLPQVQATGAPPGGQSASQSVASEWTDRAEITRPQPSAIRGNFVTMHAVREAPSGGELVRAEPMHAGIEAPAELQVARSVGNARQAFGGDVELQGTVNAGLPSDGAAGSALPCSKAREADLSDVSSAGPVLARMPGAPQPSNHESRGREPVGSTPAGSAVAVSGGAVESEGSTGVTASFPSGKAKLGAMPTLAAQRALPSAERRAVNADAGGKTPTRRPPTASAETGPAPEHLMLREIGEKEALASMRDAHLGSRESQLAAQGLARALMQAGYARVQVVVNGHQQVRDESTDPDEAAPGVGQRSESTGLESTTNIQSARHGN